MIAAYPLQWPEGWPRSNSRVHGKFFKTDYANQRKRDLTVTEGLDRVLTELQRFGVGRQDVVISTNVRTRLDGLPRSGEKEPSDSGVAVYWETRKGERRVMAIDRYSKVGDNLAAIAATLDAMRAIERHGGAQILDRAFTGFLALGAPDEKPTWRTVMNFPRDVTVTADMVKSRYRSLSMERHPDHGGAHDEMAELNAAYSDAQMEVGSNA